MSSASHATAVDVGARVRRICALQVTLMSILKEREHAFAGGAATRNTMQMYACATGVDVCAHE
eukprot:1701188-Pleurochrysis_carterae.AAC.1